MSATSKTAGPEERWLSLGANCAKLPERLLLWHAQGKVLLVTGAGTSLASRLPDFRRLVLQAYETIDPPVYAVLRGLDPSKKYLPRPLPKSLTHKQIAEIKRFVDRDYDVVLGMLERRIDGANAPQSAVRLRIADVLRKVRGSTGRDVAPRPSGIHRSIVQLSDRGIARTVVTTNFDLLLESAARHLSHDLTQYSLGAIPRPGRGRHFEGVLHIHGALPTTGQGYGDMVVTDQDFGEFYLRRRIVPDFIYDAARLFHLVLVGYSANDAPMRYLLNAVAADGSRFDDLKERFAFVGMPSDTDQTLVEDWNGRGITPIPYHDADNHGLLSSTLKAWTSFVKTCQNPVDVDALAKRLTRRPRAVTKDDARDLFDHLVRRSTSTERLRISSAVSKAGADVEWLTAISSINREPSGERF